MLLLWNVTDDRAVARAALDGTGPSIVALLSARATADVKDEVAEARRGGVIGAIKLLWNLRGMRGDIQDLAGAGAFKRVFRAGAQTNAFLERAEAALLNRP